MTPVSLHLMEIQTIPSCAWAQRSFVSRFLPGEVHPSLLQFSCISSWIPYSLGDTWRARNRTLESSCPQLLLLGSPPPAPWSPRNQISSDSETTRLPCHSLPGTPTLEGKVGVSSISGLRYLHCVFSKYGKLIFAQFCPVLFIGWSSGPCHFWQ